MLRVYVCVQTVEEFVRRHGGCGAEGAVVVSLSGGVDSMVLCFCLNRALM
jgi:tRNA(Ile)-lysidine synthase TilS/MesJ